MVRARAASKNALADDGWSREEEAKLHRAHLLVRATPNFWRDIAKLVPGKTANECFNKFYSAHPTPPAPVHHARSPSLSSPVKSIGEKLLSPSKLLQQAKQKRLGGKITGKSRSAIIKSHKAVREILRKQQSADQGYEEDAFSALESVDVPSWDKVAPSSPKKKCSKKTTTSSKSSPLVSKGKTSSGSSSLQSPEVLKHCADEKKHDRYLDLLIRRNKLPMTQRRNARKDNASTSNAGGGFAQMWKSRLESGKNISEAKSAVISSARDVLEQAAAMPSSDDEEEMWCSDQESEDCD